MNCIKTEIRNRPKTVTMELIFISLEGPERSQFDIVQQLIRDCKEEQAYLQQLTYSTSDYS